MVHKLILVVKNCLFSNYKTKYKEENEYLKQIIKQMRDEIETLASDLPQNRKLNNSVKSFKNQSNFIFFFITS